jgi:hypothetical protein
VFRAGGEVVDNFYLLFSKMAGGLHVNLSDNIPANVAGHPAVPALFTDEDIKLMAENPRQVIENIQVRATHMSSVLMEILREPHGEPDWGLNE